VRLDGLNTTLLLARRADGLPEIVHWGARLPPGDTAPLRDRALARNLLDDDIAEASVFPTLGVGLFHAPALAVHRGGRDWSAEFSDAAAEAGADGTLAVTAHDRAAGLRLLIEYGLRPDGDVLTVRATLTNAGDAPLTVDHLASGVLRVPPEATELRSYGGRWAHEFTEARSALPDGTLLLENRRGRTSHDRFPLLIAATPGCGEQDGAAWGLHLGWSGNHRMTADRLGDGSLLVAGGELLMPGEVTLAPGESLPTPTVYAAWSGAGLGGLARAFHAYARRHLLRLAGPRPVTLNTWEGTYFDHDEARLMREATAAAALGIERFVLDDGWMPGRDHERAGLGDWTPDPRKYPHGLGPLAHHVTGLGMQFGLWVEPEMANPDSAALRDHPDAALALAGRPLRLSRHQLVLDLTREDVWTRVHGALDALLGGAPIGYLKWDMNRDLVSAGNAVGRPAARAQVLATYALLDRLRADHPAVEIESCASGGARADWGVLARTQRVWTSDCTDALERLRIQRGAARLLPPEVMGAHVAASPNHQTGRRHTLAFRAAAALLCHFGVELDPLTLDDAEREELAGWIALHKRLRPLLHAGLHVAADPLDGRTLIGVVAPDAGQAVYLMAQEADRARPHPAPLRLPGLRADASYRLRIPAPQRADGSLSATHRALYAEGVVIAGGMLAHAGLTPPPMPPETAVILELHREP